MMCTFLDGFDTFCQTVIYFLAGSIFLVKNLNQENGSRKTIFDFLPKSVKTIHSSDQVTRCKCCISITKFFDSKIQKEVSIIIKQVKGL